MSSYISVLTLFFTDTLSSIRASAVLNPQFLLYRCWSLIAINMCYNLIIFIALVGQLSFAAAPVHQENIEIS
jgi:hypothetical protein